MPIALITGASRGLGEALAHGLAGQGWSLVVDARGSAALEQMADRLRAELPEDATITTVAGDVADPEHRRALALACRASGGLDLLVNNASALGPSPLPPAAAYPLDALLELYETNVVAPLGLVQATMNLLSASSDPRIVAVTSDAAVEAFEGWAGYGSSKAALEQLHAVLGRELPGVRVWTVDPGDLRTQMHQDAFPGEDISDRPEPATVVPSFLKLIASDRPSGRIKLAELDGPGDGDEPSGRPYADVPGAVGPGWAAS
jgi:NAD(P)-dependent dehydrogenase (short-subunit alcohol dehydrogenase family)